MRIGYGYDVHAFTAGDHLVLGGVKIPYTQAFEAHSDGDVLIHAICDALLGALALGDIGHHYPDNASDFLNIDSRILLRDVYRQALQRGYVLGNLDTTIIAQAPKMAPHIQTMRTHLAADLQCDIEQINVKATTTEKLGFEGRSEGIAAHAVALLLKA
ncbi:2-C-methyl-D-erythritol 2,4-cyclodiphosphate synthase [Thiolinea disciformis]|uniref:2-C-methyl-D-erythritol 2,4-cyclodiphosphate synthase n=1 Tax=Thiolinea disciformis TaxID=125614 RepID=UPI0003770727|nr:2-C-methyl-D-erythritol 2,4-cyclodiphosphate synthase [Thiolinea disciformis]